MHNPVVVYTLLHNYSSHDCPHRATTVPSADSSGRTQRTSFSEESRAKVDFLQLPNWWRANKKTKLERLG